MISPQRVEAVGAGEQRRGRLPVPDRRLHGGVVRRPRRAGCSPRGASRRPASAGNASNHEPQAIRTLAAGPADPGQVGAGHIERVRRGIAGPDRDRVDGTARSASDRAMAPDPVPRSTITSGIRRSGGQARGPTSATSCSVSGRGISTRRSTSRSSRRKAQCPSTYWSGSPRAAGPPWRRAGRRPARVAGLVEPERPLRALEAAGLLAQPAGLVPVAEPVRRLQPGARRQVVTPGQERRAGGPARRPSAPRPPRPARRPARAAACRA